MSDARALFLRGDLAAAIEAARGSTAPADVALVAVARGDWMVALRPAHDPVARWCRGAARLALGDAAGARDEWSRVIEDAPGSPVAWKDRALASALLGERDLALRDLAQVAARSPDDVVPHLWTAGLGGPRDGLEPFAKGEAWSARLAALVLGRATPEDLLALPARDEDEARRRRCQVHGYAGLIVERADEVAALRHYEACAATEVWTFLSHAWARARLAARRAGRAWS